MKRLTGYFIICMFLLSTANLHAEVFFSDSFDRIDNMDIDASSTGMSGTLSPIVYQESFEGSGAASSIQILSNQLNIAVGAGMSNLYLDHNFTDAGILTAGGFSVSLEVVSITDADDQGNRFGGFGVGLTRDEAEAAGDIFDHATTLRGGASAAGVSDLFVDLALDQNLRVWNNGTLLSTINVGAASGTIEADFFVSDFNAGSSVTAIIYFNGIQRDTQSFTWDNTGLNYIGMSGRTAGAGVFLDNLNIDTTTQESAIIFLSVTDDSTIVKEGEYTDEIIFSITSDPLAYPVTIDVTDILDPNQVTVNPSELVFSSADWQTSQIVTITAIDDDDMERETHETSLGFTVTADPSSPYCNYIIGDLEVQVEENDCGAWGFDRADYNLDCQVNLEDFAKFAQEWVEYSVPDPECEGCETWGFNRADFNLDCQIGSDDFAYFAVEWTECSDVDPGCQDFRP